MMPFDAHAFSFDSCHGTKTSLAARNRRGCAVSIFAGREKTLHPGAVARAIFRAFRGPERRPLLWCLRHIRTGLGLEHYRAGRKRYNRVERAVRDVDRDDVTACIEQRRVAT